VVVVVVGKDFKSTGIHRIHSPSNLKTRKNIHFKKKLE
jgi:hypothetical protein